MDTDTEYVEVESHRRSRRSGDDSWRLWALAALALTVTFLILGQLPLTAQEGTAGANLSPRAEHWFGTDGFGFDVFTRTMRGVAIDLPVAVLGAAASVLIGVPIGLMVSRTSQTSERIMRVLDVFQSFPLLVLALVVVSFLGNRIQNIIWAIIIINVPRFIRMTRSEGLVIQRLRFVEAARSFGTSELKIALRHVLPNIYGLILAQVAVTVAHGIVVISALTFVGVGGTVDIPSWGGMIRSGAGGISLGQWWPALFPGMAVFLFVAVFNYLGAAVRRRVVS